MQDAGRFFLREHEAQDLFNGDEAARVAVQADFDLILQRIRGLSDPRLRALAEAFVEEFGPRFRRAAAARHNHHRLSRRPAPPHGANDEIWPTPSAQLLTLRSTATCC